MKYKFDENSNKRFFDRALLMIPQESNQWLSWTVHSWPQLDKRWIQRFKR